MALSNSCLAEFHDDTSLEADGGEINLMQSSSQDRISISQFSQHVIKCAKESSENKSDIIYNKTLIHASIILKTIAEHSKSELLILTSYLNDELYGTSIVVNSIDKFISRGGHIRILIEQKDRFDAMSNSLMSSLRARSLLNSISIRYVPTDISNIYSYHFAVSDTMSYRIEQDKEKKDSIACFGDKELGSLLIKRFNEIWELSVQ